MWESLPPQVWTWGGPGVLVMVCVLLLRDTYNRVMAGRLVPDREVARLERDRDEWRSLAMDLAEQNRKLLGISGRAVDVLEAIPIPQDTPNRGPIP